MSSTGKTPTHPNSSKKLPPAAAEVAQHEAAEVAQHEAAGAAEAAEAVQYEPAAAAAAAVAEASQFGEAAAAAEAAVAGLAYNGRHWVGSGSANRVISPEIGQSWSKPRPTLSTSDRRPPLSSCSLVATPARDPGNSAKRPHSVSSGSQTRKRSIVMNDVTNWYDAFNTRTRKYACGAFDRVNFHHEPSPLNLLLLYLLRELLSVLRKVI
jgi:hypothetical protein